MADTTTPPRRRVSDVMLTVEPGNVAQADMDRLRELITTLPTGELRSTLSFIHNRLYTGHAVTMIRHEGAAA